MRRRVDEGSPEKPHTVAGLTDLKLRCMHKLPLLLVVSATALLSAPTLDVPLTLEETAGVDRVAEPVTFGVPVPKGVITDTARVRLYNPAGEVVPASFRVVSRWWDD